MDLSLPMQSATASAQLDALNTTFLTQKSAYARAAMPNLAERRANLETLLQIVHQHQAAICNAISADFSHRSQEETQLLEIFPAVSAIKHAKSSLRSWMRSKHRFASMWFLPARTEIRPQPLGVVGIIVPWNYPILLALGPLVAALSAGNRVMIKMSEFTPKTGALLQTLIAENFAPDHVTVINGEADIAVAFSNLAFDHLLFTGSTSVGRHVMRAAANNLTPVTLELGGKSPAIVGPECNLDDAAQKIMFGKCLNAGQTCIAPDYVLVPAGREQDFVAAAKRAVTKMYPMLANNGNYTAIINDRHYTRLQSYLGDASSRGASLHVCNPAHESFEGGRKIAPTLVLNAPIDSKLMTEEIFGPLLPVLPYDSLNSAIDFVNTRDRPLALYYFGWNSDNSNAVISRTIAGGVTLNECLMHISQEELPFGGVGASGMGAYHGRVGFETFSKMKPIFHQARLNGLTLFHPPYGKRFKAMIKLLLR
jgi:coniferyl-aldehyde dehydrogenase